MSMLTTIPHEKGHNLARPPKRVFSGAQVCLPPEAPFDEAASFHVCRLRPKLGRRIVNEDYILVDITKVKKISKQFASKSQAGSKNRLRRTCYRQSRNFQKPDVIQHMRRPRQAECLRKAEQPIAA
jgi:hypothetical protein